MTENITPHPHAISTSDRSAIKPHQPAVLWLTGLSGSGKSTIANALEVELNRVYQAHTYLLDGDNIRKGLNSDLGFAPADRAENIRRIGEVAKLMADAGLIVLTAFISPFREDRDRVRAMLPEGLFIEVYVRCPLSVCEQRDPKGLYRKARDGKITEFTGISSPYEEPLQPELVLDSGTMDVATCVEQVVQTFKKRSILRL